MNEKLCSFVAALPRWPGLGDSDAFRSLRRHSALSSAFEALKQNVRPSLKTPEMELGMRRNADSLWWD